jgi:hypothetical protein
LGKKKYLYFEIFQANYDCDSPSILKPLIPKSAASPCPPGKTYSVGWLKRMFPTISELSKSSVIHVAVIIGAK